MWLSPGPASEGTWTVSQAGRPQDGSDGTEMVQPERESLSPTVTGPGGSARLRAGHGCISAVRAGRCDTD